MFESSELKKYMFIYLPAFICFTTWTKNATLWFHLARLKIVLYEKNYRFKI